MKKNEFMQIEWAATDLERTGSFLFQLFGWRFEPWIPNHFVYRPEGGGIVVSLHKVEETHTWTFPVAFVEVEEIASVLAKVEELGGKTVMQKIENPGVGWFAQLSDLDGNIFGLFEGYKK